MKYIENHLKYTMEDLLGALASDLGCSADDPRILDAYDELISGWARESADPDAAYNSFFRPGPVATELDLTLAHVWADGRILID
ncbi:hypothetical protein [Arthrobacter sp. NA-172]|uniref:hypothetical protein n=1 Tax=Arthrobacter sp. NA-172 TaxID=3367524 RepID=UPI003753EC70